MIVPLPPYINLYCSFDWRLANFPLKLSTSLPQLPRLRAAGTRGTMAHGTKNFPNLTINFLLKNYWPTKVKRVPTDL